MIRIGVLGFQGSIEEHLRSLSMIEGVVPQSVKTTEELNSVDGLIMPGGESTTIGKLIEIFGVATPILEKAKRGMPVWGTCAGMILLAKEIVGEDVFHFGLMDMTVKRNAYGSQLDSFHTTATIPEVSEKELPIVFIRAPWVERVGKNVQVLLTVDGKIVAAKQDNLLATSFHPELTEDLAFHQYFVDMVKEKST